MKRTLAVLAILTLIVPAVASAQTLSIRGGNNPALGQIVSRAIAGLRSVQHQTPYSTQQIRRRDNPPAFSQGYQNGYAQGLEDARRSPQFTSQYSVNNGYRNQYPQSFANQPNGFQRHVRSSWRGGY